ncbi:MAG: pilus assembly protein PilM [Hydrogenoanaerobacterium sp.]
MSKTKLGINIGAYSLKLAQCGKRGVERTAVAPLPDNLVKNGHILSMEAMTDFLRESVRANHLSGRKNSCVILPAGVAFLRRVTMPAMSQQQLCYNLPYEFRDYAEQGKEHFLYDYSVLDIKRDEDGRAVELELLAAAVPKETITEYKEMFHRAGLHLKTAVPAECAYTNLIRTHMKLNKESDAKGRCIINLEHSSTQICIFIGDHFETTRAIEIGSADIDRAIAATCNVDEHIAHSYRATNYDNVLMLDSVREVYGAIAVEVMRALNFYNFNNGGDALEYAYFCGDGAEIEPLIQTISQAVSVELHSINELMPMSSKVAAADTALCSLAIGITHQ